VTEPVARAVSPRRTVRVAVALVAGQATLCAVIGWVTFGPPEPAPQAAGVNPLTSPIELPTSSLPLPPLPMPPAPPDASMSKAAPLSPRAPRSSKPATSRATSKPAAEEPRPIIATDEVPPEPPPTSPTLNLTPPPSAVDEVQFPVVEGAPCSPEGAQGLTSEQVELRCEKDDDGDLVWQIN
jgi:hypothetical protein